jgi:hypothetical protein
MAISSHYPLTYNSTVIHFVRISEILDNYFNSVLFNILYSSSKI